MIRMTNISNRRPFEKFYVRNIHHFILSAPLEETHPSAEIITMEGIGASGCSRIRFTRASSIHSVPSVFSVRKIRHSGYSPFCYQDAIDQGRHYFILIMRKTKGNVFMNIQTI